MLPRELKKPIDDLQSPSNKILIVCLILAIIFLAGVIIQILSSNTKDCADNGLKQERAIEKQARVIDSLFQVIIYKTDKENERLMNKDRWQDSVKYILQNEIKNEIKRKK